MCGPSVNVVLQRDNCVPCTPKIPYGGGAAAAAVRRMPPHSAAFRRMPHAQHEPSHGRCMTPLP